MSRLGRWLGALLLLGAARRLERREALRAVSPPPRPGRAAGAVLLALAGASMSAAGFIVAYVLGASTQLLGVALGALFACLSVAAIVAGKRLVAQEERSEPLEDLPHEDDVREAATVLHEGAEGISRRSLIVAAGGTVALTGCALALPAASLGPVLGTDRLLAGPWRDGRRLVDEEGRPILADDIEIGSFVTAFPEGAEHDTFDGPLVVARMRPDELRLPPERADWAVDGIVAYSKICTHAGCAITLYDYPLYQPTSPRPRLVCPCHYSVFDAPGGGGVLGGPAGRPLPQLPLGRDAEGALVARGPLSQPPGPSWSRVRQ
jgi:ubiquinol-cytochrome c reductase iron-sulfur subunit